MTTSRARRARLSGLAALLSGALVLAPTLTPALTPAAFASDGRPTGVSGPLVAWGDPSADRTAVPSTGGAFWRAIAAGGSHAVGLLTNREVRTFGQGALVPVPPSARLVSVAAGDYSVVGVTSHGSLGLYGVFPCHSEPDRDAGRYERVAIGDAHSVGLLRGGRLLSEGATGTTACSDDDHGQTDVDLLNALLAPGQGFVDVDAGGLHTVALRSDGVAFAIGDNRAGQVAIGATAIALPRGVRYTAVSAGSFHTLLLRSDGRVDLVGAGDEPDVPLAVPPLPVGLRYVAVSAGQDYSLFLRSDGVLLSQGRTSAGLDDVPALAANRAWSLVSAGRHHAVAVYGEKPSIEPGLPDGDVVARGDAVDVRVRVGRPGGAGPATGGVVRVQSGALELGSAAVGDDGTAVVRLLTASLRPGRHDLEVNYGGFGNVALGRETIRLRVLPPAVRSTTTLRVRDGEATVRVFSGLRVPTGRIELRDGGRLVRVVGLGVRDAGTAVVRLRGLSPGRHRLRARFLGTLHVRPSASPVRVVVVRSTRAGGR